MKFLVFILFWTTLLFGTESVEKNAYELGSGVQVGTLPLYVGGYFSLDYRNAEDENHYRVDDLAVIAYGGVNKLSYLAELEFKEFYTLSEENSVYSTRQDTALHVERLYLDYNFDENYMLRIGKFNSQVGFWNLLPVNVLRDTTSNPISTNILFPRFTSGIYASYTSFNDAELKLDIMLQHNDDFDANYNNYKVDEHYSLGATYSQDDIELKLSVGMFDNYLYNNMTKQLYYFLASLKYETENYKIMGELGSQKSKDSFTTPYAGYLQGLYHLNEKHSTILRLESYEDKVLDKHDEIAIFGYTYRPLYPIAIKAEYQIHTLESENQFLFSFSVLF